MESLARINLNIENGGFVARFEAELKPGITALFGPSGSGKSTILRAIAGLQPVKQGFIDVSGSMWLNQKQAMPASCRGVGVVFQQPTLFEHLSVYENITYGFKRTNRKQIALESVIETLQLAKLLHRMPETLSGGEKQRVAIARALASQPNLLLMDEPMASLDRQAKKEIMPFIVRMHREFSLPILYVSHDPFEVAQLADDIIVINNGNIICSGHALDVIRGNSELLFSDASPISVIEGTVKRHFPQDFLTLVSTPIGDIWHPELHACVGDRVRLQIHATDVSVCLSKPEDSSISNIFPMEIHQIQPGIRHSADVYLSAHGCALHATITLRSVERLGLKAGMRVFAQIKTVAVLGTEMGS